MKLSRKMIFVASIFVWSTILIAILRIPAFAGRHSPPDSQTPARWYLVFGLGVVLAILITLAFSRRRLLLLTAISIAAGTALGALWLGTLNTGFGTSIGTTRKNTINGVAYHETKVLGFGAACGGLS